MFSVMVSPSHASPSKCLAPPPHPSEPFSAVVHGWLQLGYSFCYKLNLFDSNEVIISVLWFMALLYWDLSFFLVTLKNVYIKIGWLFVCHIGGKYSSQFCSLPFVLFGAGFRQLTLFCAVVSSDVCSSVCPRVPCLTLHYLPRSLSCGALLWSPRQWLQACCQQQHVPNPAHWHPYHIAFIPSGPAPRMSPGIKLLGLGQDENVVLLVKEQEKVP